MALLDLRFASAALIRSILTGMYLALGACTKVAVAGRSNVYSPTGGRGQRPPVRPTSASPRRHSALRRPVARLGLRGRTVSQRHTIRGRDLPRWLAWV